MLGRKTLAPFLAIGIASLLLLPLQMTIAQPPNLERIIFIDYVGKVHTGPAGDPCGDGSGKFRTISGGLRWLSSSFPVSYFIDPAGSGLDAASTTSAVVNAFNTWDAQEHPAGTFFTSTSSASGAEITVAWEGMDGSGGALATASILYNPATKAIVHVDIRFDSGDSWFVSTNPNQCTSVGGSFDIENVAAHEIGHSVGLGHASDSRLTMYQYASPGETLKRSLGVGDQKGLDKLY